MNDNSFEEACCSKGTDAIVTKSAVVHLDGRKFCNPAAMKFAKLSRIDIGDAQQNSKNIYF